MNTHDKIELPPLPPADRYFEFDSHRMKASIDIPYWGEKSLEAYTLAAIEPYAKRIAQLEAALFAYASELPPDENGDPDVGSIHENIRKLKAELEADRKRRGEPVDKGPWKAGVNRINKRTFIQSDDFTHDVRLYVDGDFADQDEKLAYALGIADQLNAAPQPAEAFPQSHEPQTSKGGFPIVGEVYFRKSTNEWVLELSGIINDTNFIVRHSQPADTAPEDVPGLATLYATTEPVNKTDWNAELASWSDEDFIHIFHERPDLASRLRKILAEPVKSLIDNQEPLGEEFQRVLDEHGWDLYVKTAEPVKVDAKASVPSNDLAHEIWTAAQTAPGEGIEDAVDRVAAILARL